MLYLPNTTSFIQAMFNFNLVNKTTRLNKLNIVIYDEQTIKNVLSDNEQDNDNNKLQ